MPHAGPADIEIDEHVAIPHPTVPPTEPMTMPEALTFPEPSPDPGPSSAAPTKKVRKPRKLPSVQEIKEEVNDLLSINTPPESELSAKPKDVTILKAEALRAEADAMKREVDRLEAALMAARRGGRGYDAFAIQYDMEQAMEKAAILNRRAERRYWAGG